MSFLAGLDPFSVAWLGAAALVAGFLDAMVGGGSLVMLPALDEALPAATPVPSLLGTNKFVDLSGNLAAIRTYIRGGSLRIRDAAWFALAGALGGLGGALFSFRISSGILPWLLLGILPPILLMTLVQARRRPSPGAPPGIATTPPRADLKSLGVALALGVYDGFLGAGTGALLVFSLVQVGRHDHLQAVAAAKAIHGGANLAALIFFIALGRWIPSLAILLAVANICGSLVGARLALKIGTAWVRLIFILTVGGLILRLGFGLLGR